ncbi:hypothetical protein ACWD01_07275 [Streptomyces sp. NPDC002835]|jgi:hypothetical protein
MALRGRERLVALRVRGDVIVAQVLLWPDEIRAANGLAEPAPEPHRQELQAIHVSAGLPGSGHLRLGSFPQQISSVIGGLLVQQGYTLGDSPGVCPYQRLAVPPSSVRINRRGFFAASDVTRA